MNGIKEIKDYQVVLFAIILTIGIVASTAILTQAVIKLQNKTISVTGSASENVTSDLAVLKISYKTSSPVLKTGYNKMVADGEKIKAFLVKNGVNESDIKTEQISNYEVNKRVGNYFTNEVDFYKFDSSVKVTSKDVDLITKLSKQTAELVNEDILVSYSNVEYFVSNIDDIKIKMVGEATKNAKARAQSMVNSTGGSIGSLSSAKMGVFQIVPVNSNEVSDYGINDTGSIDKKVVAVVNASFSVK